MKTKYPTVMIGCPVGSNREFIIQYYLNSLYSLDYPKKRINLAFLYNYSKTARPTEIDNTRCMIDAFKESVENEYKSFQINEFPHDYEDSRTPGRDFNLFSTIRNEWLNMRSPKDEFIFSVDSDIIFPTHQPMTSTTSQPVKPVSDVLQRLMAWDKPIVAALVYNGLTMGNQGEPAYNYMSKISETHPDGTRRYIHRPTGVLMADSYWKRDKNPPYLWRVAELPKVCMTGACMLIKKEVLDAEVKFSIHEQGEDISFSEDAINKGFDCYMDFTLPVNHIMSPQALNEFLGLPTGISVYNPGLKYKG